MDKEKITAAFVTLLLITTFTALLLPQATATPTRITSVTPEEGYVGKYVGDIMRVIGEIDTANGTYRIFFDDEDVKNGTAIGTEVDDTFIVPSRPMGNYNVTLHDATTKDNYTFPTPFALETAYFVEAVVPPPPEQLQEGESTEILVSVTGGAENTRYWANITVTDPSDTTYYNDTLRLTNTTNTGSGNGNITYPKDFSAGAHTSYTGKYNIAFNGTLGTGEFTIGLTNATEYHRFQVVNIRATNYIQLGESAWVKITRVKNEKIVFSENVSAVSGVVEANWTIPSNAPMGLYNVTITNSTTPGTIKPVPDTQNFAIVKIPFQVQTKKLDEKGLASVLVDVYNATGSWVDSDKTDGEGWVSLSVEGGNYTIEASWAIKPADYVLVGTLVNQSIEKSVNITLLCWIAHLKMAISPPLPFINIALTCHYNSKTMSHAPFETNSTGIVRAHYVPTNISYTIVARRYGFLFYNETFPKLPVKMGTSWVNLNITCPTYTTHIHVLDSKGENLPNVRVSLTEWSSWIPVSANTTDDQGNVNLPALFGRYKVKVYNYSAALKHEVVLNETMINLIEDGKPVVIHCITFNVDLYVEVLDYFRQSIPKAMVKVELKVGSDWVKIDSSSTGLDGVAEFTPLSSIVGGEGRVSVYVAGELCGIKYLYLYGSRQIQFKIDKYIVVGRNPVETSRLIACISIVSLAFVFGLALTYRKLLRRFAKKEATS